MKIWVLINVSYDYYRFEKVEGVFSTPEIAEQFATNLPDKCGIFQYRYGDWKQRSLDNKGRTHYMLLKQTVK